MTQSLAREVMLQLLRSLLLPPTLLQKTSRPPLLQGVLLKLPLLSLLLLLLLLLQSVPTAILSYTSPR